MCILQSEQVIELRNVLVSLETTNGHQIRQISNNWIITCGPDAGTLSKIHAKTAQHCRAEDCLAINMECMIYHRSSLVRQSYHVERDFDRVLLKLVDILNTTLSLNTERATEWADIRHWNVRTVDEKVVQSLIQYYWIFRTRLHVHLKNWTLNTKWLHLLNHMSYFNIICRICGLNPHL